MFLVNQAMTDINIGTAALIGLLGYLVVFTGLVFLMIVVMVMGKIMATSKARSKAAAPVAAAPAAAVKAPAPVLAAAPGSAGTLKLHTVADRDAAIIMAIVADKLGKPLNELRFKSIKEV
jgi:Na+-transporting methylmalonyl-CoA/oxaloacetate decarboxylase gamma subunit